MAGIEIFTPPEGEDDKHAYHTPLEQKIDVISSPFQDYINSQVVSSSFLFGATILAIIWASMPTLQSTYEQLVDLPIGASIAHFHFKKPLVFWVNDVFLTLFFFFVGLEIKREFLVGELTNKKRAALVVFAAIGGMLVPALIYLGINYGQPYQSGWGIPIATDTAFALGILACFKNRLPQGVFAFMAAVAIIDDIGAIIVIALCYSTHINAHMINIAFLLSLLLALINYAGFRRPLPYILVGFLLWMAVEHAGIHGTVAGIVVAFLIPARPRTGPKSFIRKMKTLIERFEARKQVNSLVLEDAAQHETLEQVREIAEKATTPLQRWESKLELPIALLVLPLFALVNAGIPISYSLIYDVFVHPMSLGIVFGLVLGKPLGIMLMTFIAQRTNIGELPDNTHLNQLTGVALLTGIGFTMSIFISSLYLSDNLYMLVTSKAAVLTGSLISGLLGTLYISVNPTGNEKCAT